MTHHEAPAAIAMQEVTPMRRNRQFLKSAGREHSTELRVFFDVLIETLWNGWGRRASITMIDALWSRITLDVGVIVLLMLAVSHMVAKNNRNPIGFHFELR
jgi:hypothetical protein